MSVGTLAATLLKNMLADEGVYRAVEGVFRTGEGTPGTSRGQGAIRASQES